MNEKDTSREGRQALVNIYRQMPIAGKTARIFEAYHTGKILAVAGLRQSHPNASEERIWYLWAKQHLGEKFFNDVYENVLDE